MLGGEIAIIPARSGSKRIPKKNIIDFHGKPMIAWTIEAAIQSKLFSHVFVDTDSVEIAEIARAYGAEVPFFRELHADDLAPVSTATVNFVERILSEKLKFEDVFQLMANCPLRNATDLISFHRFFHERNCSFALSCFEMGWTNPWWSFKMKDHAANFMFPDALTKRSQDLEKIYAPTGAIWAAKTKQLLETRSFYGPNQLFFELDWKNAIDIDSSSDLEMARFLKSFLETIN